MSNRKKTVLLIGAGASIASAKKAIRDTFGILSMNNFFEVMQNMNEPRFTDFILKTEEGAYLAKLGCKPIDTSILQWAKRIQKQIGNKCELSALIPSINFNLLKKLVELCSGEIDQKDFYDIDEMVKTRFQEYFPKAKISFKGGFENILEY